jgi:hypothetical protein
MTEVNSQGRYKVAAEFTNIFNVMAANRLRESYMELQLIPFDD